MSGPQEPEMIYDSLAGGPYVEQTGEPGKAATKDERWEDIREWAAYFRGTPAEESWTFIFGELELLRAEVAAAEERGAAKEQERLLRIYHREPMSQDCRDGSHFGGCTGCRCICHGPNGTRGGWNS